MRKNRGLIPTLHSTEPPMPAAQAAPRRLLRGRAERAGALVRPKKARWVVWRHRPIWQNKMAKSLPDPHNSPPLDEYT